MCLLKVKASDDFQTHHSSINLSAAVVGLVSTIISIAVVVEIWKLVTVI